MKQEVITQYPLFGKANLVQNEFGVGYKKGNSTSYPALSSKFIEVPAQINLLTEIKSALIDFNTMMNPDISHETQYRACQTRVATSNYMSSGGYSTQAVGYSTGYSSYNRKKSSPIIEEENILSSIYNSVKKMIFK